MLTLSLWLMTPKRNSVAAAVSPSTSRELAKLSGGLQDQICDFDGVGYQAEVTRLDLDRPGTHPLGHEALEVRIDGAVLRRDRVEARLGSPGSIAGLAGQERLVERLLHRIERSGLQR